MICGDQKLHWLDVQTGEAIEGDVATFAGKYFYLAERLGNSTTMITFDDQLAKHVKVTDWKGWTDIRCLIKTTLLEPLFTVETKHGKILRAVGRTMLPVYNPDEITKGFHGETKYDHRIVPVQALMPGDLLRVLHSSDELGNSYDFDPVLKVIATRPTDSYAIYELQTKSQYINVGDIYVYAGSRLDEAVYVKRICDYDGDCDCKCVSDR